MALRRGANCDEFESYAFLRLWNRTNHSQVVTSNVFIKGKQEFASSLLTSNKVCLHPTQYYLTAEGSN